MELVSTRQATVISSGAPGTIIEKSKLSLKLVKKIEDEAMISFGSPLVVEEKVHKVGAALTFETKLGSFG